MAAILPQAGERHAALMNEIVSAGKQRQLSPPYLNAFFEARETFLRCHNDFLDIVLTMDLEALECVAAARVKALAHLRFSMDVVGLYGYEFR